MDFLDNDFLAAYVELVDLQVRSAQPNSPVRVEEKGFDLQSHLIHQICSDSVKKQAAERKILSTIRTYLNQGKSASDIEADYSNDPAFLAVFGKNFSKNLARYIEKSQAWDEHKNQVEIFFNLLCHTYQAAQSKKIQKDTKQLAPFILTIAALFTAKDCNPKAILATHVMRNVGAIASLSEVDLEVSKQKRKWLAYEKVGFIKFYPGKQGGESNRVEILAYSGPDLTQAQKLEAVEIILEMVKHEDLHQALSTVLTAIASMEGAPRYNDCDLGNKVEDLLAVFAPIASGVVETRKAERLIESADFEAAVQDEAQELADKVSAHLASGRGFQPKQVVEPSESVAEPLTELQAHRVWLQVQEDQRKALAYAGLAAGLEF